MSSPAAVKSRRVDSSDRSCCRRTPSAPAGSCRPVTGGPSPGRSFGRIDKQLYSERRLGADGSTFPPQQLTARQRHTLGGSSRTSSVRGRFLARTTASNPEEMSLLVSHQCNLRWLAMASLPDAVHVGPS